MPASRREFLCALAAVGTSATLAACGCGGDALLAVTPQVQQQRFVYCLSLRGRRGSRAAKRNAAYKRFVSAEAALAGRAHPGDTAQVVSVPISEAVWQTWFGNGAQEIDLQPRLIPVDNTGRPGASHWGRGAPMQKPSVRHLTLALAVAALPFVLPASVVDAGPPCVCWPIQVGDAAVPDFERRTKDPDEVVTTVLATLTDETPVLARMETLRRASLALQAKSRYADRILSRLMARVLDAETGKARFPALAWFDAGYAVACFRQADAVDDLHGYPWIARAIQRADTKAHVGPMHYAAALAVLMPHPAHHRFGHHLAQMEKAADDDPLLASNLAWLKERYPAVLKHFAKARGQPAK